jgi:hypothetical protein
MYSHTRHATKGWFRKMTWVNRKVTGRGQVGAGKKAVDGNDPYGGHRYISVGDMALFQDEGGEPLDGTDQIIVY